MIILAKRRPALAAVLAIAALTLVACGGGDEQSFDPATFDPFTTVPVQLGVGSPDIENNGRIPMRFTCDGADEPPLISWEKPPDGTRAVAFIFDDPDAPRGIFVHWVAFNLDPDRNSVADVIEGDDGRGHTVGINDFGDRGYGGPCPPGGETHLYRFSVFALIAPLALDEDASAEDVLRAMRGSVIGHGVLSAEYSRQ